MRSDDFALQFCSAYVRSCTSRPSDKIFARCVQDEQGRLQRESVQVVPTTRIYDRVQLSAPAGVPIFQV